MKARGFVILTLVLLGNSLNADPGNPQGPVLGETLPSPTPKVFSAGFLQKRLPIRDLAFSPDGRVLVAAVSVEMGSRNLGALVWTRQTKTGWTDLVLLPHQDLSDYNGEPCFSADGTKLFFASNRPDLSHGRQGRNHDLWEMDFKDGRWGEPANLGAPVNTEGEEFFPSLTRGGALYFNRRVEGHPGEFIYRAAPSRQGFAAPEKLPAEVNAGPAQFNATVDRDERFLIVPAVGRPAPNRQGYFIVFRRDDGRWSQPLHLGPVISPPRVPGWSSSFSPDGHQFFFHSGRPDDELLRQMPKNLADLEAMALAPGNGQRPTVFWMDATFIQELKTKAVWTTP